jgi:hypothetical protein
MDDDAIVCYNCHKKGHKANKCPEKEKGKDERKCYRCDKVGHIAHYCWEDEKNAHKRPANWKSSRVASETAASATDSVADTAAMVHSTPHKAGMRNAKQASKAESVRMGNGADVKATTIAQIPGVICDKDGRELKEVVLDSLTHLPGAKYNLFSLSKMIRQGGWKLHGDNEAIWIEKDGVEIRFDIIIPTPRGALYCMRYKRKPEAVVRTEEIAMSAVDQDDMSVTKEKDLQGHCRNDKAQLEAKSKIGVVSEPRLQCETCAKRTKANVHSRKQRMPEKAKEKNVPMIERRERKNVPMIERREKECAYD